jgi:hypothetical protein
LGFFRGRHLRTSTSLRLPLTTLWRFTVLQRFFLRFFLPALASAASTSSAIGPAPNASGSDTGLSSAENVSA